MAYIWQFLKGTVILMFKFRKFAPKGLLSLFLIAVFFYELFTIGFSYASVHLVKSIFGAELVINQTVKLAILDSPEYTLLAFFGVVSSVMMLYYLVKFIGKFLIGVTGSQARAMSYIVALLIVGIIEISAIAVIDKALGFVPLKDGLFFLVQNIKPIILNIHFF